MAVQIMTGDILAVRAWCTAGNQAAVNTYCFEAISSTGGGATDLDLGAALAPPFALFYKALLPPNCSYNGLQVYFLLHSGGLLPPPANVTTGTGVGTTGDTCLPRGMAGILKYRTNFRGPAGRGRVFLPFVSADYQDVTALPTAAYDVLVNSFASNMLTPLVIGTGGNTVTLVWEVVKRKKGIPPSGHQIVVAESADKWGQMHKRGEYGRTNASPV